MKVEIKEPQKAFKPIQITIESEEELAAIQYAKKAAGYFPCSNTHMTYDELESANSFLEDLLDEIKGVQKTEGHKDLCPTCNSSANIEEYTDLILKTKRCTHCHLTLTINLV
jgi:hypothetical protein